MYIDNWQWFFDFEWDALRNGKTAYLELPRVYRHAWQYLERAQYPEAIVHFNEGLELAKRLNLPIWEFFFESWISEVYVLKAEYRQALDYSAKLVAKSTRAEFQEHPCRPVVYFTLAWVYYYLDAVGYETEILAAIDALESGMPVDEETHQRSFFLRAELAYEKDEFNRAEAYIADYMQRVEGNPFRESSGYGMQRLLAFVRGDLPFALEAIRLREISAIKANLPAAVANALLWQGVLLRYMGDSAKAEEVLQRGVRDYELQQLPKQASYYHILASYQEACQNFEQAYQLRGEELRHATASGSLNSEFHCRLDRLLLLNRMGKAIEDEYTDLLACIEKCRKPEFWRKKAELAKAGQKSRYAWQRA